jgi:raffinose/stachyose/melibiose transport system permease protein
MQSSRRYPGESKFAGWFYLLPAFSIYLVFVLVPVGQTVLNSFYEWNGFAAIKKPLGFKNYLTLFTPNSAFLEAFLHNLIFIFFYTIIPVLFGLMLASLLGRTKLKGLTAFRTLLFLPQVISMVVVGVVWRWVFHPNFGLINTLLRAVGLSAWAKPWLGDFTWALPAVGSIASWVQYGFCMVLFLAGMQRVPEEYYEASSLDGATAWQQLWKITFPALRPEIAVAVTTTVISALRVFDLVFVTTRGGPGTSTMVIGQLLYNTAFINKQLGSASAMATVLLVLILLSSGLIRRYQEAGTEVGS